MAGTLQTVGSKGGVDRTGLFSKVAKFTCDTEAEAIAFLSARSPHEGLPFIDGDYEQTDAGDFDILANYGGFPEGADGTGIAVVDYDFDGGEEKERIETNPNFKQLKELFEWDPEAKLFTGNVAPVAGEDGLDSNETSALEARGRLIQGTDSWLVTVADYTVTFSCRSIPSGTGKGVNTIVRRPPGIGALNIDFEDRVFLKLAPKITKHGNASQVKLRYKMSGPLGASPDVYFAGQLGSPSGGSEEDPIDLPVSLFTT